MKSLQVIDYEEGIKKMSSEQLMQLGERIRDQRIANIEKATKEQGRIITIMEKSINDLKENTEKARKKIDEAEKEFNKLTKTFMTNGTEKRECEKYMNNLIYNVFKKNSLESQLLHGYLTARCKAHLVNTFPDVSKFDLLRVDDIDAILKIMRSFLSAKNIKIIAKKRIIALHNEKEKRQNEKVPLTYKKEKDYKLLEALLEKLDFNIDNL